jgi:ABC-type multidrug transport system fused ATPase/permease subunit
MERKIDAEEKDFTWLDVPRTIWHFAGQDRKKLSMLVGALFAVYFYELTPPLVVGWLVDFFTNYQKGESLKIFYVLSIGLGGAQILASVLRLASKRSLGRILAQARARARTQGFEKLLSYSLEWHANENSGNKTQRLLTGSQAIREWGYMLSNELIRNAVVFAGVIGAFAWLDFKYAAFFLAYMAVYFMIEKKFAGRHKVLCDKHNKSQENSTGIMVEGASNIMSIKALGAETDFVFRQKQAEDETAANLCRAIEYGIGKWQAFQFLGGVACALFLLMAGNDFLSGRITVGMIVVYFGYFMQLRNCTASMADLTTYCIEKKSDLARMMRIFQDTEPPAGHSDFPGGWDELVLKRCGFSYPSGQEALCGVDLTIRRREKIGIAGLSGSGKSTLVKLLLGLYKLDNGHMMIGGVPYKDIEPGRIMDEVSVVLQESELFNMSLRDNIALMREVPQDKLDHAVRASRLEEVIARLPDGIDTEIGEKGYRLSGGERQRLGIARAICKGSPILILDEATSALDTETEKHIMDFLLGAYGTDRTVVVIAHRISTLRETDRVIVFDQGLVVEEGRYADLATDPNTRLGSFFSVFAQTQNVRG